MNNNLKPSEKICSPFMCYCQKVIPLAFDESMSYYEQLCNLVYYLKNTVIPAVNNNADALTEVQEAFKQLERYVDDYFKNLDIQTEINNKLDEMAESGQLSNIIAQYLQVTSIIAFNNINEMKNADNLVNGSFTETYGFYNQNDGGGAKYKVRTITNNDTIDEITIIALKDDTLIAELIYNDINIKQFGAKGDGVTDDTEKIKYAISKNKNIYFPYGIYLTSDSLIIDSDNIKITSDNAIIKPTNENINCFNINGNYIIIDNLNIDGKSIYGYNVNGSHNIIKNLKISNINHSAIMNIGNYETIENVTAINCGWDCVSNYGNSSYNTINNCKAIETKRHGFSTDPNTHHISFINCYCENIGNPELNEPHSCYHFEYSNYGVVQNCKVLFNLNHLNNQTKSNQAFTAIRVYESDNVLIDNINILFDSNYNPLDVTRFITIENSDNFKLINSTLINNSNNSLTGYSYTTSKIDLINNYIKDMEFNEQDSYSGFIKNMINCYVDNTYRTSFFKYNYLCEDSKYLNCHFIGNNGLLYFFNGRFVNTLFENCIFENGQDSIILYNNTSNANLKSINTKIYNCEFANLTRMINIFNVENNTIEIMNCLFKGTCNTVFQGYYNSAIIKNCKKLNLTYTNLKSEFLYVTIYDDLSTNYDYQCFATNNSNERFKIIINEDGNVIATRI